MSDSENMKIWEMLKSTPEEARRKIESGRLKGKTDINPMWRLKMLTQAFGPCGIGWWYEIKKQEIVEGANGVKAAFVDIDLYYRWNGEISKPVPGSGGSLLVASESKGLYTSDECFKMALTDALSVCCKELGMSEDIYFEKGQEPTKYGSTDEPTPPNEPAPQIVYITETDAAALKDLAQKKGVVIEDILAKYKLKELKEMPLALYQKVAAKLKGAPDVQVPKQS